MRYSLVAYKDGCDTIELKNYGINNEKSLTEIINFTNEFNNEEALTEYLLQVDVIPKEYSNASYGIRFYKSEEKEPKLLQYGISYKRDKNFFDVNYLTKYFVRHMTNLRFMELFLAKYYNYLVKIPAFEFDLKELRKTYINYFIDKKLPIESYEYMISFVKTYTKNKSKNKNISSGLRDLAMFAIDFERTFVRKKEKNKFKDINYQKELENLINHYKYLLANESLNVEEYDAYMKKIDELMQEMSTIVFNSSKEDIRVRSIDDEITRH